MKRFISLAATAAFLLLGLSAFAFDMPQTHEAPDRPALTGSPSGSGLSSFPGVPEQVAALPAGTSDVEAPITPAIAQKLVGETQEQVVQALGAPDFQGKVLNGREVLAYDRFDIEGMSSNPVQVDRYVFTVADGKVVSVTTAVL
jgi:hypothetical protein